MSVDRTVSEHTDGQREHWCPEHQCWWSLSTRSGMSCCWMCETEFLRAAPVDAGNESETEFQGCGHAWSELINGSDGKSYCTVCEAATHRPEACRCLYGRFVLRDGSPADHRYTMPECPVHAGDAFTPLRAAVLPPESESLRSAAPRKDAGNESVEQLIDVFAAAEEADSGGNAVASKGSGPVSDSMDMGRLRALASEATPGPWATDPAYLLTVGALDPLSSEGEWSERVAEASDEENAAYIAACSPDVVLGLLDALDAFPRELCSPRDSEVAALQARLEEAERARDEHAKRADDNLDQGLAEYHRRVAAEARVEEAERALVEIVEFTAATRTIPITLAARARSRT